MENTRFMIASGGTGGHFYPGLALGLALRELGKEVLFVVRKNEPSIRVLTEHQLSYKEIDLCGLPRSVNPVRHLSFLKKLSTSLFHTRRLINDFNPDVALGTGGYISFPLLLCARLKGIKTAVHDSNSRLGLVNRVCGHFTTLFMLGLPVNKKIKNSVLVSTPLRPEFLANVNKEEIFNKLGLSPSVPTVLVVGGSQGAKGLNEAVVQLAHKASAWQFIHITGTKWFETLKESYKDCPNVRVLDYSHEIYALMKTCDLTICRSGAGTVAELIACRLPAVLVPFPHATEDHQYYNAKVIADCGAAEIIRENPALAEQLYSSLLSKTPEELTRMRGAYQHVPVDPIHATEKITQLLIKL